MSENTQDNNPDKKTQTLLHVTPHVLSENERALVTCSRSAQTAVTAVPITLNTDVLYSLLEFIPYKDIEEDSIRELELPRKQRLQFQLSSEDEDTISVTPSSFSEREKRSSLKQPKHIIDEISEPTSSLPFTGSSCPRPRKANNELEVQTNLTVAPHVLEDDEIAKVYMELSTQTLVTLPSKASINKIIPLLKNSFAQNETLMLINPSTSSQSCSTEDIDRANLANTNTMVNAHIDNAIETTILVLRHELDMLANLLVNNTTCNPDNLNDDVYKCDAIEERPEEGRPCNAKLMTTCPQKNVKPSSGVVLPETTATQVFEFVERAEDKGELEVEKGEASEEK